MQNLGYEHTVSIKRWFQKKRQAIRKILNGQKLLELLFLVRGSSTTHLISLNIIHRLKILQFPLFNTWLHTNKFFYTCLRLDNVFTAFYFLYNRLNNEPPIIKKKLKISKDINPSKSLEGFLHMQLWKLIKKTKWSSYKL